MKDMLFEGTMHVTGEHGTGKTVLGLEAGDPNRTLFVDDDEKGRVTVAQIRRDYAKQGVTLAHEDFTRRIAGKRALGIHLEGRKIIRDEIKKGQYDAVVWDTWTRFAASCHAYVQTHPDEFRDPERWAAMGKIRAGEEYKEARLYEAELVAELQEKVPLVILISHLKNQYLNNAPTGKEIPATSKAIDRICVVRLWLRHNPDPKVDTPVALVLKNFGIQQYDPDIKRLRTVRIFPTKITPKPGERSLWDSMRRYYENPAGLRPPTADEIPNDFESSIVHGTLTEDQRLGWMMALKQQRDREEEEKQLEMMRKKSEVMRLSEEEGMSYSEISKELDLPVKNVVELLKE